MKIIAIILVVGIIGFAIFKISKKKKARQSTYKGPSNPKRTTTTPVQTATAGYDSTGKPVKLPSETPDEFAERERAWAHSSGYYSGKR